MAGICKWKCTEINVLLAETERLARNPGAEPDALRAYYLAEIRRERVIDALENTLSNLPRVAA